MKRGWWSVGAALSAALAFGIGCGESDPQRPDCEVPVQDGAYLCEITAPEIGQGLRREGTIFVDEIDRHVLFRGVNAGGRSKFPPFFPFPFAESGYPNQSDAGTFDEEMERYVDKMEEWGLNIVRLPFSWEALEPTRGEYDELYLERLIRYIEHLNARDILVVLDFHQDVFSRHFCGDGFPLWAVSEPRPEIPAVEDCDGWFMQYVSGGRFAEEFDRFWKNDDGLRDAFLDMWRHVITQTLHLDGVVAYEMINEPYEGTIPTTEWVRDYYIPLVEAFAEIVAELAPQKSAVFGSPGTDTLSGTTHVTRPAGDNLVFSPHFYDPTVYVLSTKLGRWDPPRVLGPFFAILEEWEMPGFVGESGCRTEIEKCDLYLRAVYEAMDGYPWNVTTWEYSATVDDWNNEGFGLVKFGGEERSAAAELVRVYPKATAGTWGEFTFDRESGRARYDYTATAGGVTELRAPARLYGGAPVIRIEEGDACAHWDEARQLVLVRATSAGRVRVALDHPSLELCDTP